MKDNYRIKLGSVYLHFWHTPGHTLESSCVLLAENTASPYDEADLAGYQIRAVFTGDTLFLGDVGRPDLTTSTSKTLSKFDLARMMFDSVQRLGRLPADVVVFPGHGAGSACGKSISSATRCSIGKQRQTNYAFQIQDQSAFVEQLTSGIPPPPDYFFYNASLNKTGQKQSTADLLAKGDRALSAEEFHALVEDPAATVLDCRSPQDYKACHVPKSLFSPLKGKFAIWAANIISSSKHPIALLCDQGAQAECITRLARTGIDTVVGHFSDLEQYKQLGFPVESARDAQPEQLFELYSHKPQEIAIVDVRSLGEFSSGHIDTAQLVSLSVLNKSLDQIETEKQVFLHCRSGTRSLVAYSYLDKAGFTNMTNVNHGYKGLLGQEFKIVS